MTHPTPPPDADEAKERKEDARIIDALMKKWSGHSVRQYRIQEYYNLAHRASYRWPACIAARDAEAEVERLREELAEVKQAYQDACTEGAELLAEAMRWRWVPVSERLPEESKVLVLSKFGSIDTAIFVDGMLCNDNWHFDVPIGDGSFTHWMPLPLPPKD